MVHDIFISHSRLDDEKALLVYDYVNKKNIQCWIDVKNLITGKNFPKQIVEAIKLSRAFILIYSENSNVSRAVINEVRIACDNNIPIIPIRLEDVKYSDDMDYLIGSIQWINAFPLPLEIYFPKIMEDIQAHTKDNNLLNIKIKENEMKPLQTQDAGVVGQKNQEKMIITGRIVTKEERAGLPHSYVALLDATNRNHIFSKTESDVNGFYAFNDVRFNYKQSLIVYAKHSLFGDGYSKIIDYNESSTTIADVDIIPIPAKIIAFSNKQFVSVNGDYTFVETYTTDALGDPVKDGTPLRFMLSETLNGSGMLGEFTSLKPKGAIIDAVTKEGWAGVRFGWASTVGVNRINVVYEKDNKINASINININPKMY